MLQLIAHLPSKLNFTFTKKMCEHHRWLFKNNISYILVGTTPEQSLENVEMVQGSGNGGVTEVCLVKMIQGNEQQGVCTITCLHKRWVETETISYGSVCIPVSSAQADFIKLPPQVQERWALYTSNLDLFNCDYHISPSLLALYCKHSLVCWHYIVNIL